MSSANMSNSSGSGQERQRPAVTDTPPTRLPSRIGENPASGFSVNPPGSRTDLQPARKPYSLPNLQGIRARVESAARVPGQMPTARNVETTVASSSPSSLEAEKARQRASSAPINQEPVGDEYNTMYPQATNHPFPKFASQTDAPYEQAAFPKEQPSQYPEPDPADLISMSVEELENYFMRLVGDAPTIGQMLQTLEQMEETVMAISPDEPLPGFTHRMEILRQEVLGSPWAGSVARDSLVAASDTIQEASSGLSLPQEPGEPLLSLDDLKDAATLLGFDLGNERSRVEFIEFCKDHPAIAVVGSLLENNFGNTAIAERLGLAVLPTDLPPSRLSDKERAEARITVVPPTVVSDFHENEIDIPDLHADVTFDLAGRGRLSVGLDNKFRVKGAQGEFHYKKTGHGTHREVDIRASQGEVADISVRLTDASYGPNGLVPQVDRFTREVRGTMAHLSGTSDVIHTEETTGFDATVTHRGGSIKDDRTGLHATGKGTKVVSSTSTEVFEKSVHAVQETGAATTRKVTTAVSHPQPNTLLGRFGRRIVSALMPAGQTTETSVSDVSGQRSSVDAVDRRVVQKFHKGYHTERGSAKVKENVPGIGPVDLRGKGDVTIDTGSDVSTQTLDIHGGPTDIARVESAGEVFHAVRAAVHSLLGSFHAPEINMHVPGGGSGADAFAENFESDAWGYQRRGSERISEAKGGTLRSTRSGVVKAQPGEYIREHSVNRFDNYGFAQPPEIVSLEIRHESLLTRATGIGRIADPPKQLGLDKKGKPVREEKSSKGGKQPESAKGGKKKK
jgi:hypothetical protein